MNWIYRYGSAAALAIGLVSAIAGSANAQYREPAFGEGSRTIDIVFENLHDHLVFSPGVVAAHAAGTRLFAEGETASFAVKLLAEEGNVDPLMGETQFGAGSRFGSATVFWLIPPKGKQTAAIRVGDKFPLISGLTMIGQSNDGIVGFDSVDTSKIDRATTIELYALDAGTEVNTEAKADLAFHGGLGKPAEELPVRRHPGIKGDKDIGAEYRFDPAKPLVRVTLTPRNGN